MNAKSCFLSPTAEYLDHLSLRARRDTNEPKEDDVAYEFENEDSDRPKGEREAADADEIENDVSKLDYKLK